MVYLTTAQEANIVTVLEMRTLYVSEKQNDTPIFLSWCTAEQNSNSLPSEPVTQHPPPPWGLQSSGRMGSPREARMYVPGGNPHA